MVYEEQERQALAAQQQTQQARQDLQRQRQNVSQYKQQAQEIEVPQRDINFQFGFIQGNRQLAGKTEQVMQERQQVKQGAIQTAKNAEEELNIYEQTVLVPAEKEASAYAGKVKEAQYNYDEYQLALRATQGFYGSQMAIFTGGHPVARQYYQDILEARGESRLPESPSAGLEYSPKSLTTGQPLSYDITKGFNYSGIGATSSFNPLTGKTDWVQKYVEPTQLASQSNQAQMMASYVDVGVQQAKAQPAINAEPKQNKSFLKDYLASTPIGWSLSGDIFGLSSAGKFVSENAGSGRDYLVEKGYIPSLYTTKNKNESMGIVSPTGLRIGEKIVTFPSFLPMKAIGIFNVNDTRFEPVSKTIESQAIEPISQWQQGLLESKYKGLTESLNAQYQTKAQAEFDIYAKGLPEGLTGEQQVELFKSTPKYSSLEKEYQSEFSKRQINEYRSLDLTAFEYAGAEIGKSILHNIPTDVATAATYYGGYKLLSKTLLASPGIINTASAAIGGFQTWRAIDPFKTLAAEERAGSAIQAATIASPYLYRAASYPFKLKDTLVSIGEPYPKTGYLKAEGINKQIPTTLIQKFKDNELVTTKFTIGGVSEATAGGYARVVYRPYQKWLGLNPTYAGSPYGATYTNWYGLTNQITRSQALKGYGTALKYAERTYGLTETGARSFLRMNRPYEYVSITEGTATVTQLNSQKPKISIEATRTTKPLISTESVKVKSTWGIVGYKTKGGKIITESIVSKGKEIAELTPASGAEIGTVSIYKLKTTETLFKAGRTTKDIPVEGMSGYPLKVTKKFNVEKVKDYDEYVGVRLRSKITIGEEQNQIDISRYSQQSLSKLSYPVKSRKAFIGEANVNVVTKEPDRIFSIDYGSGTRTVAYPRQGLTISQEMGWSVKDDLGLGKVLSKSKPPRQILESPKQVPKVESSLVSPATKSIVTEKTKSALSSATSRVIQKSRTAYKPISVTQQKSALLQGVATGTASSVRITQAEALKMNVNLKSSQKVDVGLRPRLADRTAQAPKLEAALKLSMKSVPRSTFTNPRNPISRPPRTPAAPEILFPFQKKKQKKEVLRKKQKRISLGLGSSYKPSFTSAALGLRGAQPKETKIGYLPGQKRLLPKWFKPRRMI